MRSTSPDCKKFLGVVAKTILHHGPDSGIHMWRTRLADNRVCDKGCKYGLAPADQNCASCLEGRLRTVNLYDQNPLGDECIYLRAAQTLKEWVPSKYMPNPTTA